MKEGVVYTLINKYNQHPLYVGSTIDFKERKRKHRKDSKNPKRKAYNYPIYKHVRKYGTIKDWNISIIYEGPDFRLFEKNYIKSTWFYNLNEYIPLRTKQEKKDRDITWRRANKEKLSEYNKKWQKDNDKAYKKKQRETKAIHRAKNKEKLNEKAREKVTCNVCGDNVNRSALGRHKKSLKCRNFNS
tara:strand:- start:180 stop:740 length:561 start_codon:yes stop_codon:yes gene_type:complete